MARIVLADIKGTNGFVNKDTIVGGFGARFKGFSITTLWLEWVRRFYQRVPSIQMAYLAAIFRKAGHEVFFTDGDILEGDVAIILSSIVDYKNERYWARKFRKKNRHSRIGFIGACATYLPELFEHTGDFIIQGEPEKACMEASRDIDFKGRIKSDEIDELDILPLPDWDIFNFNPRHPLPGTMKVNNKVIPMVTSRSCPEKCAYCPHRLGGSYRLQSVERVMEEITHNYKKFGSHYIIFRDSNFTRHRDRVEHFIREFSRRNLDIYFEIETRIDALDTELLDHLQRIGLRRITFGIESLDAQNLQTLQRRPISTEEQRKIIDHCQKIGIQTQAFYMFGFSSDNIKSIIETIKYSLELGTNMASYKVLTPFPGTLFYNQVKDSVFEKDWEKFDGSTLTFHHPNFSPQEMRFLIEHAYARFYSRPSQFFRYRGTYLKNKALADRLDIWAEKKHNEAMEKSLKKDNMWKDDFIWD